MKVSSSRGEDALSKLSISCNHTSSSQDKNLLFSPSRRIKEFKEFLMDLTEDASKTMNRSLFHKMVAKLLSHSLSPTFYVIVAPFWPDCDSDTFSNCAIFCGHLVPNCDCATFYGHIVIVAHFVATLCQSCEMSNFLHRSILSK